MEEGTEYHWQSIKDDVAREFFGEFYKNLLLGKNVKKSFLNKPKKIDFDFTT